MVWGHQIHCLRRNRDFSRQRSRDRVQCLLSGFGRLNNTRDTAMIRLGLLLAYIWHWRRDIILILRGHENMSLCTGHRINAIDEPIASCAGYRFNTKCTIIPHLFSINIAALFLVYCIFFSRNLTTMCITISRMITYETLCTWSFNSSPRDKMAAISPRYFHIPLREWEVFLFWLKWDWSLFLRDLLTMTHHWVR